MTGMRSVRVQLVGIGPCNHPTHHTTYAKYDAQSGSLLHPGLMLGYSFLKVCNVDVGFPQFPLTTLVTWECTIRHAVPWAAVDAWSTLQSPKAAFMAAALYKSLAYERAKTPQPAGWIACDPLAVALAAEHGSSEPRMLTGSKMIHCFVQLAAGTARGQSVFDSEGDGQAPRVRLVTSVDVVEFERLLCDSMR